MDILKSEVYIFRCHEIFLPSLPPISLSLSLFSRLKAWEYKQKQTGRALNLACGLQFGSKSKGSSPVNLY